MTRSCAHHMIITRATGCHAQPFRFTEHELVCDCTLKRCTENRCNLSWNTKHQINQLTNCHSHPDLLPIFFICELIVRVCCRSTYNDVSGDAYKMPSGHLAVGQLCAARYSGNNEWHRCYIVDLLQKKVQVASCAYKCLALLPFHSNITITCPYYC